MRSTGEPPKSCDTSASVGRSPSPGRARLAEAPHAPILGGLLHLAQGRVDDGALGQRGALAPALGIVGDDADEEQRTDPVHAGGGADGLAERKVDVDELDAGELHGSFTAGALPHLHRRCQLVRSSVLARMAEWQTRRPQKPLSERACGFESRSGHDVMSRDIGDRCVKTS